MAFVDGTVVNLALPWIQRDLHTGLSGVEWIVLAYGLMLAMLYLPGGALADRFGRRRIFLIGTIGFALASVLCGAAPDEAVLIVGRVLQGVAGGLLTPTSLGLLRATYGRDSGWAIGLWSSWTTLATLAGPPLGGALVQWASWRWIFFLNLPLAAAAAARVLAAGEQVEEPETSGRLDVLGSGIAAAALGALTFGLVEAGTRGFRDVLVVSMLAAGIVLLGVFVLVESRIANPLLPLDLFRHRNISAASIETFLVYGALYASGFLLSLYLQAIHYSPLTVALVGLPTGLILFAGAAWGGRISDRRGPRLPLTIGPVVLAAGLVLYLLVRPGSSWAVVLPGAVLFGVGLCGIVAPITNAVMQAAPDRLSGLAAGVSTTVARVGGLFAIAVAGLLMTHVFHGHAAARGKVPLAKNEPPVLQHASEDAFRVGMLFAAGLALAGAAVGLAGLSDAQARTAGEDASLPT
jgi:EmrB/QacA subfamily drug resistance transporter